MPVPCVCEVLLSLEQAVKTARHPSAIARHNALYFFVCFKVFPPFDFLFVIGSWFRCAYPNLRG